MTRQAPALKNLIQAAIEHDGFSFVEVDLRLHRNLWTQERPRRIAGDDPQPEEPTCARRLSATPPTNRSGPTACATGILVERERPEYGRAYRERAALAAPAKKGR